MAPRPGVAAEVNVSATGVSVVGAATAKRFWSSNLKLSLSWKHHPICVYKPVVAGVVGEAEGDASVVSVAA